MEDCMFSRILLAVIFSLGCLISSLSAATKPAGSTPPIALSDFVVNSANPSFTYLGKGFAEIIAFELMKSPSVKLIDREKRNQILKEMEFTMTGLTDPKSDLKMGRLLAVRYLISGSITDMAGALLVSLSMIDVESGAVVWKDQTTQPGGKYAYIGAYFAKSILKYLNMNVDKTIENTIVASKDKDEASVVALSEGIDALDAGKKEEAKKKLADAKKIDPDNKVAAAYLDKLASGSAKFKVVPDRFMPYYNPAYLGGLEKDRFSINVSEGFIADGFSDPNNKTITAVNPAGTAQAIEIGGPIFISYAKPISPKSGISFDFAFSFFMDGIASHTMNNYPTLGQDQSLRFNLISCYGIALSPNFGLGVGLSIAYNNRHYFIDDWSITNHNVKTEGVDPILGVGGVLAMLIKNNPGTVAYDFEAAYGAEKLCWFDPVKFKFNSYNRPLIIEQTLTFGLNNKKTFLALKQLNDLYFDRNMYYCRVMPCFEQWFNDAFSLRLGAEGSLVALDGGSRYGYGGTAGLTVRTGRWDIDGNFTYRLRPSRVLNDTIVHEAVIFVTFTKNGVSKK
jgi:TolB-like protein